MTWRSVAPVFWIGGLAFIIVGAVLLAIYKNGVANLLGEILRDAGVALVTTGLISQAFFAATNESEEERSQIAQGIEDERARRVERSENRRFVMDRSGTYEEVLFPNFDLRGQSLNGLKMWNAHFNEANLTEARLYQARLYGGDLIDATLVCASLRLAHLWADDGSIQNADLRRAQLQSADLRGVEFGRARLEDAVFGVASDNLGYRNPPPTDLRGAKLHDVQGIEEADFRAVVYDDETTWPPGFTKPQSEPFPIERPWPICRPARFVPSDPPEELEQ